MEKAFGASAILNFTNDKLIALQNECIKKLEGINQTNDEIIKEQRDCINVLKDHISKLEYVVSEYQKLNADLLDALSRPMLPQPSLN